MKILYPNPTHGDLFVEREVLRGADIELAETLVNSRDELIQLARDADAILTTTVPIDSTVVANLEKCRVIVRLGVGYDIVDVASCKKKGIQVCNVPDYGTEEVANHAVALLFAVHRRIVSYDRKVRDHQWGHELTWPIRRLSTLQVGVVGLGRIGSRFASSIRPFVRDVVGSDPFLSAEQLRTKHVTPASLELLFATSDIISVHLPLSEKTHHLVSPQTIALMKRKPIIINVSRGGLIDAIALSEALEKGELSGAGIDVFEDEPKVEEELLGLQNIVLTPHVAWYSEESEVQLRRSAVEEVLRVLAGHAPKNPV